MSTWESLRTYGHTPSYSIIISLITDQKRSLTCPNVPDMASTAHLITLGRVHIPRISTLVRPTPPNTTRYYRDCGGRLYWLRLPLRPTMEL